MHGIATPFTALGIVYNGDHEKARTVFQKILAGNQWSSFGYIAAEVDLARMPAK